MNPQSRACPSPELLAAFVDGHLAGKERETVLRHLADCEDCYEIFTETVRFQEEERSTGEAEPVPIATPLRPLRRRREVAVGAALLAVAAAAAVLILRPPAPGPFLTPAEELVAPLAATGHLEGLTEELWGNGPAVLGFAPGAEQRSLLLGIHLTDTAAALAAGDRTAAGKAAERLAALAGGSPGDDQLAASLEALEREIAGGSLDAARGGLRQAERLAAGRADPLRLGYGKWLEAARLAALAGDAAFFADPRLDTVLARLARSAPSEPLGEARRLAAEPEPDLDTLAVTLEDVILRQLLGEERSS